MIRRALCFVLLPAALTVAALSAAAAQQFDTIQVKAQALRGGVYMLTGSGGNIGLSTGSDGPFLIDDQFGPLTPKIAAAAAAITPRPIRFVINTHWHGDHTGGNENFANAGVLIVAHDNVRKRMSVEQFNDVFNRKTPPSPAAALPVVTFNDTVTFHLNGDDVVVFHVAPAHTDGDAVVYFTKADVIHMGDTYFASGYPFIDVSSGGNVNGVIQAADRALAMCTPQTIVIPGHGPVSDCPKLRAYRNMVATIRDRVQAEMRRGRTKEQITAAKPTADFDPTWGTAFIKGDTMVDLVYRSLTAK